MDPRELEALAHRLGENANDTEALNAAYAYGQQDPRSYAVFLEKAGAASREPTMGAHWFCEASAVWTASLNDPRRSERALIRAIDKDPLSATATEKLVETYREKGNTKGVAALHARRAKGLEKQAVTRPELKPQVAEIYAELGRVFVEELEQPERAIEAYKRAALNNPADAYSIYQARELLKAAGRIKEAIPLFAAEQDLVQDDPVRRAALYADEIEVCRQIGDNNHLIQALRGARAVDQTEDPTLKQQLASTILDLVQSGHKRPTDEITEAVDLFVELAESYDGEHGHSYALCALGMEPSNDRAAQLAMFYGEQIGRLEETAHPAAAYLASNPQGAVAAEAKAIVAAQLSEGIDEALVAALTPAEDAPAEVRASAFSVIARAMADHGRKKEATDYYHQVVESAPGHEEAVNFLAETMRGKRDRNLRDLLLAAGQEESTDFDQRRVWLQEVAELCEGALSDVDGGIDARHQLVLLDPSDDDAADLLEKSLEKAKRWDELADLILRRAQHDGEYESRVSRGMRAAEIHRRQRGDNLAAAEIYAWIVRLNHDDMATATLAVDYFLQAGQVDKASAFLEELLSGGASQAARSAYSLRFGEILEEGGLPEEAGEAFAEAASIDSDPLLWHRAQNNFATSQSWDQAARAAGERKELIEPALEKAAVCAEQADYLAQLGDTDGTIFSLRESLELDPQNEEVAAFLEGLYEQQERYSDLVSLCLQRATALSDAASRLLLRKRAGLLLRDELRDLEGMRQALLEALSDGEDPDVLRVLADDAEELGQQSEAIDYLRRLASLLGGTGRVEVALRLANLLAQSGDEAGALVQYEFVLEKDRSNTEVLFAVASLQRAVGNETASVETHRELFPLAEGEQKLEVARGLAELLVGLDRKEEALAAYKEVFNLDSDDLEALEQLANLAEATESWPDFADYQAQLIEVEGDDEEASRMALRLSEALIEQLSRPSDALESLVTFAKAGDVPCRDEYERLGDSLGLQGEVAESLLQWMKEAPAGPNRNHVLRRAYDRFTLTENHSRAIEVGLELVCLKGAQEDLARSLEKTASTVKNVDALQAAFIVLGRDLSGDLRAEEMVRQAEVLATAGFEPLEAVLHGELALTSIDPADVEPLLTRLATIVGEGADSVGIYERQVTRCKSSEQRIAALCRAAEVAASNSDKSRVHRFFEVALDVAGQAEGLDDLRSRVVSSDDNRGTEDLRQALCSVLSDAGKAARDGGRSRAAYLTRAATVAHEDLGDVERGFDLLGQALIAHTDEDELEQLMTMGEVEGDLLRVSDVITQALEEVHDGPLVRMLLRCRFELKSKSLDDIEGARVDLKKLYDLSPTDTDLASQLQGMYEDNKDIRGLVHLYEDQILRGRDQLIRGELAKKVALLWQDELKEPRETADAWRRVLRMSSGDPEAKEGLAKAKKAMRKISTSQIAEAEEEVRKEVEAQREEEENNASRKHEEQLKKAEELKARHSMPPQPPVPSEAPDAGDSGSEEVTLIEAPIPSEELPLVEAPVSSEEDTLVEAPIPSIEGIGSSIERTGSSRHRSTREEITESAETPPQTEPASAAEVEAPGPQEADAIAAPQKSGDASLKHSEDVEAETVNDLRESDEDPPDSSSEEVTVQLSVKDLAGLAAMPVIAEGLTSPDESPNTVDEASPAGVGSQPDDKVKGLSVSVVEDNRSESGAKLEEEEEPEPASVDEEELELDASHEAKTSLSSKLESPAADLTIRDKSGKDGDAVLATASVAHSAPPPPRSGALGSKLPPPPSGGGRSVPPPLTTSKSAPLPPPALSQRAGPAGVGQVASPKGLVSPPSSSKVPPPPGSRVPPPLGAPPPPPRSMKPQSMAPPAGMPSRRPPPPPKLKKR